MSLMVMISRLFQRGRPFSFFSAAAGGGSDPGRDFIREAGRFFILSVFLLVVVWVGSGERLFRRGGPVLLLLLLSFLLLLFLYLPGLVAFAVWPCSFSLFAAVVAPVVLHVGASHRDLRSRAIFQV